MKAIIIGGNAAGMSAAARLKRRNPKISVTVYERSGEVSYGACGIPYYIAGLNDDLDRMRIRSAETFREQGINIQLHADVVSVNSQNKTVAFRHCGDHYGEERYDRLIIATGASPVVPPIRGIMLPGVFTIKTLSDAEQIRAILTSDATENVAIIGGGYIGLELAEACLLQKKRVHIFESLPRLISGFDDIFSHAAKEELTASGAQVHTDVKVQEISGNGRAEWIVTDDGDYPVDLVLVAVGVRPNTGFLAEPIFDKLDNGALIVNGSMETSVPFIYAAGDCASVLHKITDRPIYLPLGTNANKQGRYAADAILGNGDTGFRALGTIMLRCMGLEFAQTGLSEKAASNEGFEVETVTIESKTHAPYYPNPKPITIRLCYQKSNHVLLGAQLMGRGESAWRVDLLACAIDRGMRAEELGRLDLGYAPPFSSVWDAVHIAANAVK